MFMHMVSIVSHGTEIGIQRSVDQLTNSYTPLNVLLNDLIFNNHSSRVDHFLLRYPVFIKNLYHCNYIAALKMSICILPFSAKLWAF